MHSLFGYSYDDDASVNCYFKAAAQRNSLHMFTCCTGVSGSDRLILFPDASGSQLYDDLFFNVSVSA